MHDLVTLNRMNAAATRRPSPPTENYIIQLRAALQNLVDALYLSDLDLSGSVHTRYNEAAALLHNIKVMRHE